MTHRGTFVSSALSRHNSGLDEQLVIAAMSWTAAGVQAVIWWPVRMLRDDSPPPH